MAAAQWKIVLASSHDLSNIGELTQARSRQLSLVLNRAGSLSFTIPMDDELAAQIWPIESAVKVYRQGSTGTILIWSGYVNTVDEDVSNNHMSVNCVGWLNRLSKRVLHRDRQYSATDDGDIIQDLLGEANARTTGEYSALTTSATLADGYVVQWPSGSSPNLPTFIKWNGKLPNEGSGGPTAYVAATRNQNYTRYQTNILQAIQGLTEIENGCDIYIDPTTRALSVYRRKRKVVGSVVFGYRWGPENVAQFNRQIDGSTVANYGLATGSSGVTGQVVDDDVSQSLYGPFEEVYSLSDVSQTNILSAYAGAEIALKATPRQLFSITPFNWTTKANVPEPFVDYNIGDQVKFVARHLPRVSVNQQVRVFGIALDIDEEGNEKLSQLQIYPGS
jgi:hypothetical protein